MAAAEWSRCFAKLKLRRDDARINEVGHRQNSQNEIDWMIAMMLALAQRAEWRTAHMFFTTRCFRRRNAS